MNDKVQTTIWKKSKCVVATLILLILEVYLVPTCLAQQGGGGGPPCIVVNPQSIVDPTLTPGENFTISIYTDYKGEDVWGYEFALTYNSNILNCVEVTNGDLITEEDGAIMFATAGVNNEAGKLRLTGNGLFHIGRPAPLTRGPGTLANVTLNVVGTGASEITLEPMTRLIGYGEGLNPETNGTEPGWGDMFYIIDSTMPNRLKHGFFANIEGVSNAASREQASEPVNRLMRTRGVQASSGLPWENIILWAIVNDDNPYYGDLAGYHDMMVVIQANLANIGIDLHIVTLESILVQEIVFERWNMSGDTDGNATKYHFEEEGWDFTAGEFFLMPTGLTWLEEAMYSNMTWDKDGVNVFPWLNERADTYLHHGMTNFDPDAREYYLWRWQEEFMHDPPMINIYYPTIYGGTTVWVEGWDPVVQFNDVSRLTINVDEFNDHANVQRKAKGNDTLIYGVAEGISFAGLGTMKNRLGVLKPPKKYSFNPLFTNTRKEDVMRLLTHDTLYSLSRDPWPDGPYVLKPNLAADFPSWYDSEDLGYEPGYKVARIPLEPRFWSDANPFNASDVKFTFDCILNVSTWAVAYDEVSPVVKNVEIVNEHTVDFILYEPYPDLVNLLAMEWGCAIVPYHQLKDIPPDQLGDDDTNKYWLPVSLGGKGLEGTGSFVPTAYDEAAGYFEVNRTGSGVDHIRRIIVMDMQETNMRMGALDTQLVDFCESVPAPVEHWEAMKSWEGHRVINYTYPASNPLWMNLNNKILSNRYVRLAIAHAINYPYILSQLLPSWGIPEAYQGKALITPLHDYFNTELEPYEYNIAKAQQYMDMWYYSQVNQSEYEKGPVGDADFSGCVNLDDFWAWWKNYGKASSQWPWIPGRDIDPDFNNDDAVTMADFDMWSLNYNKEYPFEGAR